MKTNKNKIMKIKYKILQINQKKNFNKKSNKFYKTINQIYTKNKICKTYIMKNFKQQNKKFQAITKKCYKIMKKPKKLKQKIN